MPHALFDPIHDFPFDPMRMQVLSRLASLDAVGVPLAGLWLQDWCGKRMDSFGSRVLWNWILDPQRYPVSLLLGSGSNFDLFSAEAETWNLDVFLVERRGRLGGY